MPPNRGVKMMELGLELFLWFFVIFSADLCAALVEDIINRKKKSVKRYKRRYPSFILRRVLRG